MELQQVEELNAKELLILEAFATGLDRFAVADKMGVGEKTLRGYLHKIYNKLGVKKLHQAIIWYLRKHYNLTPKCGC